MNLERQIVEGRIFQKMMKREERYREKIIKDLRIKRVNEVKD